MHTGGEQAFGKGAAQGGHVVGIGAEGAVADDVARSREAQVEDGGADQVDASVGAVEADERAGEPCGAPARLAPECADGGGGRVGAPMRRPQPGDPAALLVDQR